MRAIVYEKEKPEAGGDEVDLWLQIGKNLRTGETDFGKHFKRITSLERDLLVLASSIFACDVAAKRGMREEITRDMRLSVPVVNYHAFQAQQKQLQRILYILSHDRWTIEFVRVPGEQEAMGEWPRSDGKTLLFSGGLDSLAGAVDLLDEMGIAGVQLASHVTGNPMTRGCQNNLHAYLEGRYGSPIARVPIRTGGRNDPELQYPTDELEVSQRTRSFTFLTIGVLAARRRGMSKVVMIAENGQMAIHVPLSAARVGAFSTHTAHLQDQGGGGGEARAGPPDEYPALDQLLEERPRPGSLRPVRAVLRQADRAGVPRSGGRQVGPRHVQCRCGTVALRP
jgi:hypothetical protein